MKVNIPYLLSNLFFPLLVAVVGMKLSSCEFRVIPKELTVYHSTASPDFVGDANADVLIRVNGILVDGYTVHFFDLVNNTSNTITKNDYESPVTFRFSKSDRIYKVMSNNPTNGRAEISDDGNVFVFKPLVLHPDSEVKLKVFASSGSVVEGVEVLSKNISAIRLREYDPKKLYDIVAPLLVLFFGAITNLLLSRIVASMRFLFIPQVFTWVSLGYAAPAFVKAMGFNVNAIALVSTISAFHAAGFILIRIFSKEGILGRFLWKDKRNSECEYCIAK